MFDYPRRDYLLPRSPTEFPPCAALPPRTGGLAPSGNDIVVTIPCAQALYLRAQGSKMVQSKMRCGQKLPVSAQSFASRATNLIRRLGAYQILL